MAIKSKNTGKAFNGGNGMVADPIETVKTSFDGLRSVAEKLPEGKDKTTILGWIGDAYLAASKTIFMLASTGAPVQA